MNLSSFILGALIATLYGAAFHLVRGGGLGHLLLYLALSWLGFWAGHFIAAQFGWTFFSLGSIHLGLATILSLGLLLLGAWVSPPATKA